jgi:hypothetical protein
MSTSFENPPLNSAPLISLEPSASSYFGIVDTTVSPAPIAKRITWALLKSFFVAKPRHVPPSPIYPGNLMDMCTDGRHLYVRGPVAWGRVPLQTSLWNVADKNWTPRMRGQVNLSAGQTVVNVVYPVPFKATPIPIWIVQNTTPGNRSILSGIITESTTHGFTVTLATPPDSSEYVLNWYAEGSSVESGVADGPTSLFEAVVIDVPNEAARKALTANEVQYEDLVRQNDTNPPTYWRPVDLNNLSNDDGWILENGLLRAANNLSDVVDKAVALANLGLIENAYLINASAGPVTVTLAPPPTSGIKKAFFKKIDSSFNPVTITVTGGGTIDGQTSVVFGIPGDGAFLIANPTQWHIISS